MQTMPLGRNSTPSCTARLGRELQTPQPAIIGALQPEQHRGTDTEPKACSAAHMLVALAGRTKQAREFDAGFANAGA